MSKRDQAVFWGRERELDILNNFLAEKKSGLMHVRGRRRVGKSWVLQRLKKILSTKKNSTKKNSTKVIYFQGNKDSNDLHHMKQFVDMWYLETSDPLLLEMKDKLLSWDRIFGHITRYSTNFKTLVLMFDEIQWLSKKGAGFVGTLKKHWVQWEAKQNIKIILSGSSNKFFDETKGEDAKILRGLRTFADLWITPFSLEEIKKFYFHSWPDEEICLTGMLTGGIPYYLEQISSTDKNFIRAINTTYFSAKSIFPDEVHEILELEFNKKSQDNVAKILTAIDLSGNSESDIVKKTKLSQSVVNELLAKLIQYGIVKEISPLHKSLVIGKKIVINDFFLSFYFKVMRPLVKEIKTNFKMQNIFAKIIGSENNYYIEGFTGLAFEHLIKKKLEQAWRNGDVNSKLFKNLKINSVNFEIGKYWDKESEIDLIVETPEDRDCRIVEIKWINTKQLSSLNFYIDQLLTKQYVPPAGYSRSYYLIVSQHLSKKHYSIAKERGVTILGLDQLIG